MAVFDLAETSSVLETLHTLFPFKLLDRCAFGGCPWFPMKLFVSTAGTGIWLVLVDGCVFLLTIAAGLLHWVCTWPNVMTLIAVCSGNFAYIVHI
jgi:hypothetical protein